MKRLTRLSLAAALALPTLAGCGLRGDLKRPDPILSDAPAKVEPTTTTTRTVTTRQVRTGPRYNENGGVIPDASPSTPVSEGGLEEVPSE